MKKLIVFFFSISVFAQDYGNNAETLKLCTTLQTNSFSSNLDADSALDRILDVVGLSKNFVLAPCSDINNAVAVSFKGVRYILYDPDFMSMLSRNTSNWTNLFILAHEVGHHVNGHSLDLVLYAGEIVDAPELKKKREQELEADEFAGFVLAKLGASLTQTTSTVSKLSNEDDTYSTHPKRDKRITAISKGYVRGKSNMISEPKKTISDYASYIVNSNWSYFTKTKQQYINELNANQPNLDIFEKKKKIDRFPLKYREVKVNAESTDGKSSFILKFEITNNGYLYGMPESWIWSGERSNPNYGDLIREYHVDNNNFIYRFENFQDHFKILFADCENIAEEMKKTEVEYDLSEYYCTNRLFRIKVKYIVDNESGELFSWIPHYEINNGEIKASSTIYLQPSLIPASDGWIKGEHKFLNLLKKGKRLYLKFEQIVDHNEVEIPNYNLPNSLVEKIKSKVYVVDLKGSSAALTLK